MQQFANDWGLRILARAKVKPDVPSPSAALDAANNILGRDVLYRTPTCRAEGDVGKWGGRRRIILPTILSPRRANFVIAEMTARILLEEESWFRAMQLSERVSLARAVGAVVVAPPAACLSVIEREGEEGIADAFVITWTSALMRAGEVQPKRGTVVTTPAQIYRRGELLSWASDADVRMLAAGRTKPKTLRRLPLPDESGRVALLAA